MISKSALWLRSTVGVVGMAMPSALWKAREEGLKLECHLGDLVTERDTVSKT